MGKLPKAPGRVRSRGRPPSGARMVPPSVWLDETDRQIHFPGLTQDDSRDRGGWAQSSRVVRLLWKERLVILEKIFGIKWELQNLQ